MTNKKIFLATSAIITLTTSFSHSSMAALANNAVLQFESNIPVCNSYHGDYCYDHVSYFGMDTNGSGEVTPNERTKIYMNNGLILGSPQPASGSHSHYPDGTEIADIDKPWEFFGNTGMHFTYSSTNVLSASDNTATVDFSGWRVTWNGVPSIPMGTGAWNGNEDGVANIICGVDCGDGDTYTLDYSATVPAGDQTGFGGVGYTLHLEGTISAVPVPAAVWLFGTGLIGLIASAKRNKKILQQ